MKSLVQKSKLKNASKDQLSKSVLKPSKPNSSSKHAARAGKDDNRQGKRLGESRASSRKKGGLVSKEIANQMLDLLCQHYPNAECELEFASDFQLLTAVILSAQCTDNQVNKVTRVLFKRFPTAPLLAQAPIDEIKEIIRPTGYFNAKAQNIQACAQAIVEKFAGLVPKTQKELTTLPGVGRKTANCVLGVVYGVPGWTVDTHVQRLSQRLGLTSNTDPTRIECDLQLLFPNKDWSQLSITLIWHGRRACFARNPDCQHCPINHLCPSSLV